MSLAIADPWFEWDVPSRDTSTTARAVPMHSAPAPSVNDWIRLPESISEPAPEPQRQAKEILDWTGLSNRQLGRLLDTTHPTVGAVVSGLSTNLKRRPEIGERLSILHALCVRLAPLVSFDRGTLARALLAEVGDSGETVVDIALETSLADAYLVALQSIRPQAPRRARQVRHRVVEGAANVALSD